MAGFLQTKSVKCEKCPILKRKMGNKKLTSHILKEKGDKNVLIILEMPEPQQFMSLFYQWLEQQGVSNYTVVVGMRCRTHQYELPSPVAESYSVCNTITPELVYQYKAVITVGRGLYSITRGDDIISWREFIEYKFNQTFFYTPYQWNVDKGRKIRVYPFPALYEWMDSEKGLVSNFEQFFCTRQILNIRNLFKDYKNERFIPPSIEMVEDTSAFFEEHKNELEAGLDTETNTLDHFQDDFTIGCLTVSFNGKQGYYLPWDKVDPQEFSNWLKGKKQIYAMGKFDCKGFNRYGVENYKIEEDVNLLFHVLNTERTKNSIKSLGHLIGYGGYDSDLDEYIKKYKVKNYLEIPEHIMFPYATLDPIVTILLKKFAMNKLVPLQENVYKMYQKTLIPVLAVCQRIEENGLEINIEYLNKLNSDLTVRIKGLREQIVTELGEEFDVTSIEQLANVLEKKGLPTLGRTKKGFFETGDEILHEWEKLGYSIATLLLDFRKYSKLQNTYAGEIKESEKKDFFNSKRKTVKSKTGLAQYVKADGKIHGTIDPGMADSLRGKSRNPNLQNFTKHNDTGKLLRPVFKCPPGYLFWSLDYSGFQLRIAAINSNDKNMIEIFLTHGDLHSATAVNIFCRDKTVEEFLKVKNESPYKELRHQGKNEINFPLLFSDNAYVIYSTIKQNWSDKERMDYIETNNLEMLRDKKTEKEDNVLTVITDIRRQFVATYPQLATWIEGQKTFAASNGYVDTLFGTRRHLPQLTYQTKESNYKTIKNLNNISVNSPVQSWESITVNNAMIAVQDQLDKSKMSATINMTVHDSIDGLVRIEEVKELYHMLKETCEDHDTYQIPLLCDVSFGTVLGFGTEVNDESLLDTPEVFLGK